MISAISGAWEKIPLSALSGGGGIPGAVPCSNMAAAHRANDRAVMKAYGFKPGMAEPEVAAKLMEMYAELTPGA
ncbi:MAG: hypothetical protein J5855_02510 [Mailhella sp.]|nr:hypothetical protein [Mailhella sp.]